MHCVLKDWKTNTSHDSRSMIQVSCDWHIRYMQWSYCLHIYTWLTSLTADSFREQPCHCDLERQRIDGRDDASRAPPRRPQERSWNVNFKFGILLRGWRCVFLLSLRFLEKFPNSNQLTVSWKCFFLKISKDKPTDWWEQEIAPSRPESGSVAPSAYQVWTEIWCGKRTSFLGVFE